MSGLLKDGYKRFIVMLIGTFILILGVTFILRWWDYVVMIFQGTFGMVLAISGLVILYFLSKKE